MITAARSVLKAGPRTHVVDLLHELYWLNTENFYEYLLICVLRRMRERNMIAPITQGELFGNRHPGLYKLRQVNIPIQWQKIGSHGRNSFAYASSHSYNKYELNGEWFGDEETFRAVVKFRIFRSNENGNVKWKWGKVSSRTTHHDVTLHTGELQIDEMQSLFKLFIMEVF